MAQGQRRKIEIFTAGCATCNETVDLVKRIAGSNHDIEIHDMHALDQIHRPCRATGGENLNLSPLTLGHLLDRSLKKPILNYRGFQPTRA